MTDEPERIVIFCGTLDELLRFYDSAFNFQIGYRKESMVQQLPQSRMTTHAKAFGQKPNALPIDVID
jgi:hypothetical protein